MWIIFYILFCSLNFLYSMSIGIFLSYLYWSHHRSQHLQYIQTETPAETGRTVEQQEKDLRNTERSSLSHLKQVQPMYYYIRICFTISILCTRLLLALVCILLLLAQLSVLLPLPYRLQAASLLPSCNKLLIYFPTAKTWGAKVWCTQTATPCNKLHLTALVSENCVYTSKQHFNNRV